MAITSSQTSGVAHGRSPHGCYVRTRIFRTVKGQTFSHPRGSVDSSKLFHAKSLWGNGLISPHCDSDLPDRPENEVASRRTWQSERDRYPISRLLAGGPGKLWNRIDLRGSSMHRKVTPSPCNCQPIGSCREREGIHERAGWILSAVQIKAVQLHHLMPCGGKIFYKFGMASLAGIHFGNRPQLGM